MPSDDGVFFNQPIEVDMKTLLTAVACIPLLAACKKEEPIPVVTTPPVVVVPAETTSPTLAATEPPATQMAETAPAMTPESSTSGSSVAGASEGSGDGTYVVEKGDTLWDIAEKHKISHGDLAKWNDINDPRELQVGRTLKLTSP